MRGIGGFGGGAVAVRVRAEVRDPIRRVEESMRNPVLSRWANPLHAGGADLVALVGLLCAGFLATPPAEAAKVPRTVLFEKFGYAE
jgi:hypothetical protein